MTRYLRHTLQAHLTEPNGIFVRDICLLSAYPNSTKGHKLLARYIYSGTNKLVLIQLSASCLDIIFE